MSDATKEEDEKKNFPEQDKEEEKKAELESGKKKIEWGSQIRNYVFQPHQMLTVSYTHLTLPTNREV